MNSFPGAGTISLKNPSQAFEAIQDYTTQVFEPAGILDVRILGGILPEGDPLCWFRYGKVVWIGSFATLGRSACFCYFRSLDDSSA